MKQKVIILSAIIVILVFGAAAIGFFIGWQKGQSANVAGVDIQAPAATNEATLSINQSTMSGQISESEQLVNSFYRWYINCLNQAGSCDYQDRPDIDYQKVMQKTAEVQGYDRLLCAQNIPNFFQIERSEKDSRGIDSVYVLQFFDQEQVQLIAEVEKTDSGPKIINVICPRP